ncbi:hypothetical protein L195_g033659 [Trifolium pratense]|uniref:Aminotransferase-like plant mobile domain-containing protein n=2 Tax=Trifolium pratense TaxID=57577 RepID=A0A2K3LGN0_TRIPR|nr:hypothetical protein L195_g033659 [Trifolium pratense]
MLDPYMITAYVERWHPDTSSFHMSWSEMTITLDDVLCCLLHFPILGKFYTPPSCINDEGDVALAEQLLGCLISMLGMRQESRGVALG